LFIRFKTSLARLITWPTRLWDNFLLQRNSRTLERIVGTSSASYQQYLNLQLKRTFQKRRSPLQPRTRVLVDRLAEQVDLSRCRILCVGCRNTAELDYFHVKGCRDVYGIDLHSLRADILVMDMHHMTFPDGHFDIIYSSHSLEHAHDPSQVIMEIIRVARSGALVAIEVPVEFEPRGADLVDFKSLDQLYQVFSPHITQVLWSEQYKASGTERNSCIRSIFRIQK
jgi:SAM-dependent methyltransferase